MPSRRVIAFLSPHLQITELRKVRSSVSLRPPCPTQLKEREGERRRDTERKGRNGDRERSGEDWEKGTKDRKGKGSGPKKHIIIL